MSIDPTLLQAILAMDSYNRDKGGLKIGKQSVGSCKYLHSMEVNAFAATAYEYNGQIVISYRGTDSKDTLGKASDIWSGWLAGIGDPNVSQIRQAIDFYKFIRDSNPNKEIVLTGHSLGGGLAGLVASIG